MFWSALLLDNHHHSTAWLKAQMISKKLLNSLFNSLHMYLSHVMQTQPKYTPHNTLRQHNNIDRVKENDKSLILTYKKINKNNLLFF